MLNYRTSRSFNFALKCVFLSYSKLYVTNLYLCHEIWKRWVANGMEADGLNLLSRISRIVKQSLKHLYLISNSCQFFNQPNLKHYLFNQTQPLRSVLGKLMRNVNEKS